MRRLAHRRVRALAGALLLAGLGAPGANAQGGRATPPAGEAAQPKPAQIDRNGVLILVRSSLLALHQANLTGNYTVLRDLGAPGFASANSAARLAEIFASQRNQALDLSGALVLDPQLTQLPQILPNGLMHMAGFFPSVPVQVNFELLYAAVGGQWRLMGLSVNVGQSGPVAPAAPPQATAPAPQAAAPEPAKPAATRPGTRPAQPPRRDGTP